MTLTSGSALIRLVISTPLSAFLFMVCEDILWNNKEFVTLGTTENLSSFGGVACFCSDQHSDFTLAAMFHSLERHDASNQ